jgi:formate-dependent nitrite reductase membrane component NrfD
LRIRENDVNLFNTELRPQEEWAWLLAMWLYLGGTGGGLFVLYAVLGLPPLFGALSLGIVLAGGLVLLFELGSPLRAWRALFRARTSWLSRGVFCVIFFIAAGFLFVAPQFGGLPWLGLLASGAAATALGWIAGLSALMIMLYPAFFFRSTSSAIPFWSSPLLPLLFVAYAALGAVGVILLLGAYSGDVLPRMQVLAELLIAVNAFLILLYLTSVNRSADAVRESLRLLNRLPLLAVAWIGVVVIGMLIPLLVLLLAPWAGAYAGAGILVGALLFRYCLLKAGVYVAPALVARAPELSKISRNSTAFEREYARMASAGRPG